MGETLENLAVVVEQVELPEQVLTAVVADRGYHSAAVLARTHELGLGSYISEPKRPRRRWRGRKAEQKATYANHRRMRGSRGKKLARLRAEKVELRFVVHGASGLDSSGAPGGLGGRSLLEDLEEEVKSFGIIPHGRVQKLLDGRP